MPNDLHRTAWACRVAADATDRRMREAERETWDATDTAFYRALVWLLM
jgi:hypothetical protein